MGCPASVYIGDNLVFSVTTHDPDTGILTDAESSPLYRIYEDEVATPILTGTMAVLDNASTTGFYTELVACTAANGFENGKTYTIYVEATVGGDTGGIVYAFKAVDAVAGSGTYACTWTVNDGTTVLQNATVIFRLNGVLKGNGTTGVAGTVSMSLNSGTYTVAITCNGYTFASTTYTVSATASTWTNTFSMSSVVWPISTKPNTTTVRWRVFKTNREYAGLDDCTVYMGISQGPGVAGQIYNGNNLDYDSDTTDADGYVYFANTPKGATVAVKTATNGSVQYVNIPRDCGDTFEGLELIGSG